MLQCKIISGTDINGIEKEVNEFIRDNSKVLIDSIHQSADSNKLYISIFYHVRSKSAKMKEAAIEEIKVPITIPLIEENN
jgi:hypothetical protein